MHVYVFGHNQERQCAEGEKVVAMGELNAARYI